MDSVQPLYKQARNEKYFPISRNGSIKGLVTVTK